MLMAATTLNEVGCVAVAAVTMAEVATPKTVVAAATFLAEEEGIRPQGAVVSLKLLSDNLQLAFRTCSS